ncbi:MAG: DUF5915 domain-containing protein, partial [Treponemataceae bacterium]
MGRALRYQYNLKIRQPLKSVELVTKNIEEKKVLLEMEESIREELNVKKVVFHEKEDELVEYRAKANFRVLGKELGGLMKDAADQIAQLSAEVVQSLVDGNTTISLDVGGKTCDINKDKIIVERIEKENLKVLNEGTLTVALDSEITDDLKSEGCVRDFIRGVQNLRKDKGFEVTDRISISAYGTDYLQKAFESFGEYIMSETLASTIAWQKGNSMIDIESGDEKWQVTIEKV